MLMGEMATLVKYKLPVKVIVIKNNVLGEIKWEQMVWRATRSSASSCSRSTSPAYAKSCGAAGFSAG